MGSLKKLLPPTASDREVQLEPSHGRDGPRKTVGHDLGFRSLGLGLRV